MYWYCTVDISEPSLFLALTRNLNVTILICKTNNACELKLIGTDTSTMTLLSLANICVSIIEGAGVDNYGPGSYETTKRKRSLPTIFFNVRTAFRIT